MKELNAHKKEEIGVHAQKQQEAGRIWTGRLRPQGGQKIWELNLRTQEISEVNKFDEVAVEFKTKALIKTIIRKPKHLYCVAINEKNAWRQFNNQCKKIFENIQKLKKGDK
jgi:hypothetical protein